MLKQQAGNEAFREKRFLDALSSYEEAIAEVEQHAGDADDDADANLQLSKLWNNKVRCAECCALPPPLTPHGSSLRA